MDTNNKTNSKIKDKSYWPLLIIGLVIIAFAPWLFTTAAHFNCFDFTGTGEIGDTIGGITAPLVGTLGAILVYLSFREQRNANQIQWEALKAEKQNNIDNKKLELIISYLNNEIRDKLAPNRRRIIDLFLDFIGMINPSSSKVYDHNKDLLPFYRYLNLFNYCMKELIFLNVDISIKKFVAAIIIEEVDSNLNQLEDIYLLSKVEFKDHTEYIKKHYIYLDSELGNFITNIGIIREIYHSH